MPNKITFLNISGFTGLKYLECSNNDITGFDFRQVTGLETFIAKYNRISGELNLRQLSSLKKLDVEGNAIKRLDFSGLSKLEELNASRNMITGFVPSGATGLKTINASENHLQLDDLKNIKDVFLPGNGIAGIAYLNLSGNLITGQINLQDIVGTPSFALISGFIAGSQIDPSWRLSGVPHYWQRLPPPPPLS